MYVKTEKGSMPLRGFSGITADLTHSVGQAGTIVMMQNS